MPRTIAVALAGVLVACKASSSTSTPQAETTAEGAPADSSPTQSTAASGQLPALPPDLAATLGPAHEVVLAHQRLPAPELPGPLATKAEHQAWVDEQLEPWRERAIETSRRLDQNKPIIPGDDANAAAWEAFDRARVVYSALLATVYLSERLVQAKIPMPQEVRRSPGDLAAYQNYAAYTLGATLASTEFWRSTCTEYGADQPVPDDLAPWARYCDAMADTVIESVCAAERDAGLAASTSCGGDRPTELRRAPSDAPALSMAQLTVLIEQSMVLCFLAEDIIDDPAVAPERRAEAWRDQLEAEGVDDEGLLALADAALSEGNRSEAAATITHGIQEVLKGGWECEAFPELFDPRGHQ